MRIKPYRSFKKNDKQTARNQIKSALPQSSDLDKKKETRSIFLISFLYGFINLA